MNCYYCQKIKEYDDSYELKKPYFNIKMGKPRCKMHWRFQCEICKQYYHFSALAWDTSQNILFCRNCANNEKLIKEDFWGYTYYTILENNEGLYYKTLERLEFEGIFSLNILPNLILGPEEFEESNSIRNYYKINKSDIQIEDLRNSWNDNSIDWNKNYNEFGDSLRKYAAPYELIKDMLEIENGNKVLDAGCGSGYLSCLLAKDGSDVTGVDFSRKQLMLAHDRAKNFNLKINFINNDLNELVSLKDNYFDRVVSLTVFSNIPTIRLACSQIYRVLKQGGIFLLIEIHPCFSMQGFMKIKSVWDSQRFDEILYWAVDNYFNSTAVKTNYSSMPSPTISFRHTLSDYFHALNANGFLVDNLYEPCPTDENIDNHPKSLAERGQRIPRFIFIRSRKL
jgi:ubiquinone/menaquinone biosynthesis C-methylase UbiE